MPAQYEAIRDELMKRESEKKAKSSAAAIYISKGKTPAERSARAKELQK
jgi:hypothetical protein